MARLPTRSKKFGIGKEIGGAIYLHRDFEHLLPMAAQDAKRSLPDGFGYTVVKFANATLATSFIESPDFDTAHEPTVGSIIFVSPTGSVRSFKQQSDPFIYHHKWLFVDDNYLGFDVEASKQRSRAWLALDNIDFTRIGRLSYWTSNVLPRLNEQKWYRSQEACKILGVSSCELSHLREQSKLHYRKEGNAFLYLLQTH